ncbi:alanine--tRNA ligase [Jonesiaceae bacterium BS-20]|uniref:Alanine--tRNA ligase n=1 Tax=Jonesiaceae bacterium BS-20 TaxID=3120821 RepID=A0AAU7E0J3_9MICO
MRTADIRQRWLDYFESRDHHVVPSASLISPDPSLLFTVAGMVPFIPYMLGEQTPPWPRATSVQKCIRTGDIEEVGKTTRHGTFFQMNGNFSFGDYFKEQAITYAWDFITGSEDDGKLGFDPELVWVTVYEDDDEANDLWRSIAGLPQERIQRRGYNDNYWHTGQPGPGGPCSEIYIDRGPEFGKEGGPVVDEDRYLEIWNLVFMQYQLTNVTAKDKFDIVGPLKQHNIDTGLGLERVALLKQGVNNMYEIDQIFPVIETAMQQAGKVYGENNDDDVRFRVVADHVRSSLMLIGDGVRPSNEGRGYVLRRLMRRVIRSMRLLGVTEPVIPALLETSKNVMAESYPYLEENWATILATATAEEEAFRRTLTAGLTILDTAVSTAKENHPKGGASLTGSQAFTLHDTYGFPIDLTLEVAAEQGVAVDEKAFRSLMQEQRDRARADALAKKQGHSDLSVYQDLAAGLLAPNEFLGYTDAKAPAKVLAMLVDGVSQNAVSAPADVEIILDRTPFYAEKGGQLADHGTVLSDGGATFEVDDVQSPVNGLSVHRGRLTEGSLHLNDPVIAEIDGDRRRQISQAHTATHMIHKALQETLGAESTQAGSENSPSRIRFDFRQSQAVPQNALVEIEGRVNDRLRENLEVSDITTSLDQARAMGAMALFGEKYGDRVRVVSIGDEWSRELCAGTHVGQSGDLGLVTILGEASIGSGVRRVDALVGNGAYGFQAKERALVNQLSGLLNVRSEELPDRVSNLVAKLKDSEKQLAQLQQAQLLASAGKFAAEAAVVGTVKVVTQNLGDAATPEGLRALALDVRARLGDSAPSVVAIAGVAKDRPQVVIVTNQSARDLGVKAGALAKTASGTLGGGGGGKDDMAQGGGANVAALPQALDGIVQQIKGVVGV